MGQRHGFVREFFAIGEGMQQTFILGLLDVFLRKEVYQEGNLLFPITVIVFLLLASVVHDWFNQEFPQLLGFFFWADFALAKLILKSH